MAAAERKHEVLSDEGISVSVEDQEVSEEMPEAHDAAMKIERAKGAYTAYSELQEKPSQLEIWTLHCYNCKNWQLVLPYRVVKSSLASWRQVHKNKDKQAHNKQQDPATVNAEDGGMRLMATSFDLQIRYVSATEEQV
ncbi:hypothetical protein WN944_006907 [Citrus x changshan-huyou]|uniref:Uncharacterized protein n=1 Tax=Citrus x changshan-huyou TaxID=2935761 RepID=A0AAP0QXK7_9ROSI